MRVVTTTAPLVAGLLLAAAAPPARSAEPRPERPPLADLTDFAEGLDAFAGAFHQELLKDDAGNLVFSPYSLATALGMLRAGADAEAGAAIDRALGWGRLGGRVHPVLGYHSDVASRTRGRVANGLWVPPGGAIDPDYLARVRPHYGATVSHLTADPVRDAATINAWAKQATNGKIDRVLERATSKAYLVNAVYLNVPWETPFPPESVKPVPFHPAGGGKPVEVPMMRELLPHARHSREGDFDIVRVPCEVAGWEAVLAVPARWEPAGATTSLGAACKAWRASLRRKPENKVDLTLPPFQVRSSRSVLECLDRMGVGDALRGGRFAVVAGETLPLAELRHAGMLRVDTEGLEAAAVTIAGLNAGEKPDPPRVVRIVIDRPFYCLVTANFTARPVVFFAAQVLQP